MKVDKRKEVEDMLQEKAFANAATIVSLGFYVVCRILGLIAPELLFNIGRSWFHTFSIDALRGTDTLDLGTFLLGAVSVAVLTWVATYSLAVLYNKLAK